MTDQIISGESPPVSILLELLKEYPDQWKVKLPDLIHVPSSMRLMLGKAGVYVGGPNGLRLGIKDSYRLRKAMLRVTTWQMLALARKAQLEGRDYMNPDFERDREYGVRSSANVSANAFAMQNDLWSKELKQRAQQSQLAQIQPFFKSLYENQHEIQQAVMELPEWQRLKVK